MAGQDPSRATRKILPFKEDDAPYRRDHSPGGGRTLRALRSRGPMPANRHLSRPDIVRSGASRARASSACAPAARLQYRPPSSAGSACAGALAQAQPRWIMPREPETRQAPGAFNDFRRLTGSRREHGLDELDGLLDLLVAHRLDAPRMFNFHIPRAQQCQQLAVSCRLVLAHLGNCRWSSVPEVSEQGCNKLAVQLLAVTRAWSPSIVTGLVG